MMNLRSWGYAYMSSCALSFAMLGSHSIAARGTPILLTSTDQCINTSWDRSCALPGVILAYVTGSVSYVGGIHSMRLRLS